MPKISDRPYSRYAEDAIALLGQAVREGRIARKLSAGALAQRAGISRSLLHRMERGDPSCGIGVFFEAAAIAGVELFGADRPEITGLLQQSTQRLTLLPKAVHGSRKPVQDDF